MDQPPMTELYLIAHVVRGQPAFDIAEQMEVEDEVWWIIPTSGHRAYPYWSTALDEPIHGYITELCPDPPTDHPDHYQTHAAKGEGRIGALALLERLGLVKPKAPFTRRV